MAMVLRSSRLRLTQAIYFGKPQTALGSGFVRTDGTTPLTANWNAGNLRIDSQNSTRWFNVIAYGADPTGASDSSSAVQAAVTAAGAVNGEVYAPAGIYKIVTAITVPNNITIMGDGFGSEFRAAGNNFIFTISTGRDTRFTNFKVAAASTQASGGAFDFSNDNAGWRFFDHLWVGNNLFRVFNCVSTVGFPGVYRFSDIFIDNVTGVDTVWKVGGSGTAHHAEIVINGVRGIANPASGVQRWISCDGNVDSLDLKDVTFYQGVDGIVVQKLGGSVNSNFSWSRVVVDTMSGIGVSIDELILAHISQLIVNTCGTTSTAAVTLGSAVKWSDFVTGQVLGAVGSGMSIASGVNGLVVDGFQFYNNNTSNTAAKNGVDVAANASGWRVINSTFFNDAAGHQKYGVSVASGTSNSYVLGPNEYVGMETGTINNLGTGTDAYVFDSGRIGLAGVKNPLRPLHVNGPIRITNANGLIWENTGGAELGTSLSVDASNRLVATSPTYGSVITFGTNIAITGANLGVNLPDPQATRTLDINGTQRWRGIAAPAVSEANSATMYFDSTSNTLKASLNAAAYVNVIGSAGVTGSGVANKLAYWTSATNLTNESNITLGGAYTLGVAGDINLVATSNVLRVAGTQVFKVVFAGTESLAIGGSNNSAPQSVAVGYQSLSADTAGENTGVGYQALIATSSGAGNTAVGRGVAIGVTTGGKNTALGWRTGVVITTGSNNLFLGAEADATANNLTNAVAIGYQASVAANDSMSLGNASMKVGIHTSTPASALDVNGAVATRHLDIAVANGLNSNIALTDTSWVRLTGPSAVFSIGGFTNPTDGRVLRIYNTVAFAMTIVNEDGSSTATNRIKTLTGGAVTLRAGTSACTLIYDDVDDRWILMGTN